MRVFITGASGYIGKHVALELLSRGHQVVGLARKPSERTTYSTGVDWRFADLSDFDAYWGDLAGSDAVVHCAMDYSDGSENSDLDREFVTRVAEFSGRFLYTGNLFSERTDGPLEESLQTSSEHWRYQAEEAVIGASQQTSVIRLGFVYGGSGGYFWEILSPGTLAQFETEPVPDVMWPMVHVKDVARLYASVLESNETGVFHAFDGVPVQAAQIIESARAVYESRGISSTESRDYIQGLLKSSVLTSNQRAVSTGWRPVSSSFVENAELAFSEYTDRPDNKGE
jgi:nucleoside-diphosphate-sugar epimerase